MQHSFSYSFKQKQFLQCRKNIFLVSAAVYFSELEFCNTQLKVKAPPTHVGFRAALLLFLCITDDARILVKMKDEGPALIVYTIVCLFFKLVAP